MPELDAALDPAPVSDERGQVDVWRYRQAKEAGFTDVEASLWAESDGDVGALRKLVSLGCPHDLIAQIVL